MKFHLDLYSQQIQLISYNIFQQREGKDGMDECSCYLFPTTLARVSHGDAQLLCSGHDA